jgi:hypothetical protein
MSWGKRSILTGGIILCTGLLLTTANGQVGSAPGATATALPGASTAAAQHSRGTPDAVDSSTLLRAASDTTPTEQVQVEARADESAPSARRPANLQTAALDSDVVLPSPFVSPGLRSATPGDTCADPSIIVIPTDLPFTDSNTTCGRGNDYSTTCMGTYDSGEDMIYELVVTEDTCVNITATAAVNSSLGLGLGDTCPLASSTGGAGCMLRVLTHSGPWTVTNLTLSAGVYYLMADNWPSPSTCVAFNLSIERCVTGACCAGGCQEVTSSACTALGGYYFGNNTVCTPTTCTVAACCLEDGSCRIMSEADCLSSNGTYSGIGSDCVPNECPRPCATCPITTNGLVSDFGSAAAGDFGLWENTRAVADNRNWTLLKGATASTWTGPDFDHTTGDGYYVYFETSMPVVKGDVAILDGPCLDLSDMVNPELTFWYHMYGIVDGKSGMGTLEFQVSSNGCLSWDTLFSLSGNQGNLWQYAEVDLTAHVGQTLQVRFVGTAGPVPGDTGDTSLGDMAIDDIRVDEVVVVNGACCDNATGNCLGVQAESVCLAIGNTTWAIAQDCTDGSYHCPPSTLGADCASPLVVSLPADLSPVYFNPNTTCGRGNDYTDTCMNAFDNGEDLIYELNLTQDMCLDITMATDAIGMGFAIGDTCPLSAGTSCLYQALNQDIDVLTNVELAAGTYYLMVDSNPNPTCRDFTLTISACPTGACCTAAGTCSVLTEAQCVAAAGVYAGAATVCGGDCDGNAFDDTCQIVWNPTLDCNGNLVPDNCDIASAFSTDCDSNGRPDECGPDCNSNGIVDLCDTRCDAGCSACYPGTCGTMPDCQSDGIPDGCQIGAPAWPPTTYRWDDGTLENSLGIAAGANVCGLVGYTIAADAEIIDAVEVAWGLMSSGVIGRVYVWSDPNGDGHPSDARVLTSALVTVNNPNDDIFETYPVPPVLVGPAGTKFFAGFVIDSAEYPAGVDRGVAAAGQSWIAADTAFNLDPNDLGSGAVSHPLANLTAIGYPWDMMIRATGRSTDIDCNSNGLPDDCDITNGIAQDCDSNGLIDGCEAGDCNANGVPDNCDVLVADCNHNDVPDDCDLNPADPDGNGHTSADCQADGIPDECQLGAGVGDVVVLDESFESSTFPPAGWSNVMLGAAGPWRATASANEVHTGGHGAVHPYSSTASADSYLLTPELTLPRARLSVWSKGCFGETWCANATGDVMIVVGDPGGSDDIFVGRLNDLYTTYFSTWAEGEYDLTPLLPAGPFRVAIRYSGIDGDAIIIDDFRLDVPAPPPSNDLNGNGVPDECEVVPNGDYDGDGDVDLLDFAGFQQCFGRTPLALPCRPFDLDSSGLIDLSDHALWTSLLTGPQE